MAVCFSRFKIYMCTLKKMISAFEAGLVFSTLRLKKDSPVYFQSML